MKYFICSTRDRASDLFANPMFAPSIGAAVRAFKDEVNRAEEGNPLYKHPDDFDLYELGIYDDNTGLFETHNPTMVAVGKDMVSLK